MPPPKHHCRSAFPSLALPDGLDYNPHRPQLLIHSSVFSEYLLLPRSMLKVTAQPTF